MTITLIRQIPFIIHFFALPRNMIMKFIPYLPHLFCKCTKVSMRQSGKKGPSSDLKRMLPKRWYESSACYETSVRFTWKMTVSVHICIGKPLQIFQIATSVTHMKPTQLKNQNFSIVAKVLFDISYLAIRKVSL